MENEGFLLSPSNQILNVDHGDVLDTSSNGSGFETPLPNPVRYNAGTAFGHGVSVLGVKPWEFAAHNITHALSMILPHSGCYSSDADAQWVFPAVQGSWQNNASAGQCSSVGVPIGSHIQMDPTFNCFSSSLPINTQTICRALQVYGAYVTDWAPDLNIKIAMARDDYTFDDNSTLLNSSGASVPAQMSAIYQNSGWQQNSGSCTDTACGMGLSGANLRIISVPANRCSWNDEVTCWLGQLPLP